MKTRNIQKTGKMHYLYLPTSWSKKYGIKAGSQVSINQNSDGSLTVFPQITAKKSKNLKLDLNVNDTEILNKLIIACYINPSSSFQITLEKETDYTKLLDQKKLFSVELVELDGKTLSYESSIIIEDPLSLLKTMIRKVKNLIIVMKKNYDPELINRYEEEIDRSKIFIEKAVVSALTANETFKLTTIDLHYIASISRDLERVVDHLRLIEKTEVRFLDQIETIIEIIKNIVDNPENKETANKIDYDLVIDLIRKVSNIREEKIKDINSYDKYRIKRNLTSISDVMLDWVVTKKLEVI